ncbi:MAG: GNAT family N-acetyltransferase [Acidobacteria bacterium]|nr:GNAT family N-acetyltransferase [Acidobacteriota bacterium]
MVTVRQAVSSDAALLHRMARRLHVEGRDWNSAQATGFFLYVGSEADYSRKLSESPYCYVAMIDETPAGFLTTVTPEGVAKHPSEKNRALFLDNGQYPLLLEQIGVLPEYQGRGAGQAMLDRMIGDFPGHRIVATIIHAPLRNERSIGFLAGRNGWQQFREVRTAQRLWGFYERRGPGS